MNDNELNKLVAKTIFGHHALVKDIVDTSGEIIVQRLGYAPVVIDWVNDTALHFQLAIDNGISILMDCRDGQVIATSNSYKVTHGQEPDDYFLVSNSHVGRAIVKCFLLMKGVEIK